ncbi:PREDICTED: uncharacterized protein LOC109154289 [Ipomoea nil]|uniref:uncharacterized protein LOC109154289 n=1 Tax=Ipomoea nil TaxID=35883 RepID=UPI000901DAF5|nr:PREDICTED: uncharacterized protein LOC109154289 [Ipomoea nil]
MATPSSLVDGTKRYLVDWNNIVGGGDDQITSTRLPDEKWTKPIPGYLKLNTDAAVDPRNRLMGFGWVLRNENGEFVAAASIRGKCTFNSKETEAMAVREALTWIKSHGINFVQAKTDALQVVQRLDQTVGDSSFDLILFDIKHFLLSVDQVAISHVSRTANTITHRLAREACSMSVRKEWTTIPPSFIVNALYFDLN